MNNLDYQTTLRNNLIKKNYVHFTKYSFVGLGNLIITLVIYILFLNVFYFRYEIAFTLSWLTGVLFTYLINFIWVFKPEEKITFRKRLPKYLIIYISSYLLNMLLLKMLVENISLQPLLSQIFILPFIVLVNFTGIKYWALK